MLLQSIPAMFPSTNKTCTEMCSSVTDPRARHRTTIVSKAQILHLITTGLHVSCTVTSAAHLQSIESAHSTPPPSALLQLPCKIPAPAPNLQDALQQQTTLLPHTATSALAAPAPFKLTGCAATAACLTDRPRTSACRTLLLRQSFRLSL
jgi:hypothetical protein